MSPGNIEYIKTIEESSFVVCLDDAAPETDSEQVRQAWFGDGFNRWADKSMQIIVAANGKSSAILEHGGIDGLTSWRFSEWVQRAILDTPPVSSTNASDSGAAPSSSLEEQQPIDLEELTFQSTPDLDRHMLTLRDRYVAATSTAEYKNHYLHAFGTADLMAWGMPVKSVLDVTVQLAIHLHYGHNVPCWEGVSMSHYHKGRSDMLQIATPQVARFCADAAATSINEAEAEAEEAAAAIPPVADLRTRLVSLGRDMTANLQRCQAGRNHLRFFEMLRDAAWPRGEPTAKMFAGNMFWRSPFVILQHVPEEVAGASMLHGVQKKDCFFVSLSPKGHRYVCFSPSQLLHFQMCGEVGSLTLFQQYSCSHRWHDREHGAICRSVGGGFSYYEENHTGQVGPGNIFLQSYGMEYIE